jgi:hypothetical protein
MLSAGRDSANPNDFALVAMLGLLGLRIFEATGSDVTALGEARGHRVLKVLGKGEHGERKGARSDGREGPNAPIVMPERLVLAVGPVPMFR